MRLRLLPPLCAYQLYAPPPPPGAYMGRNRGECREHLAPGVGKGGAFVNVAH